MADLKPFFAFALPFCKSSVSTLPVAKAPPSSRSISFSSIDTVRAVSAITILLLYSSPPGTRTTAYSVLSLVHCKRSSRLITYPSLGYASNRTGVLSVGITEREIPARTFDDNGPTILKSGVISVSCSLPSSSKLGLPSSSVLLIISTLPFISSVPKSGFVRIPPALAPA